MCFDSILFACCLGLHGSMRRDGLSDVRSSLISKDSVHRLQLGNFNFGKGEVTWVFRMTSTVSYGAATIYRPASDECLFYMHTMVRDSIDASSSANEGLLDRSATCAANAYCPLSLCSLVQRC